ncbi:XRE family transcriptional regulator [Oleomonas cavernae]|uniref:XRE family transcriptional regulator n=1 Tax=Oleomonas cavernae TaxID=2320859 RepID=A0A418WH21_9PROT|nr:XRE family transcriptional regulator [Oleomonas cavernae]
MGISYLYRYCPRVPSWRRFTLAQALDLSFQQIQKYESGANRLAYARLLRIAGMLGVSPVELTQDEEGMRGLTLAGVYRHAQELAVEIASLPPKQRNAVRAFVRALAKIRSEDGGK